jgi:hypothetical protein
MLNIATNQRCRCGTRETPEHLLLSCPIYGEARSKLRSDLGGIRLSLNTLLNTTIGTKKVLEFLKTTSIATRRWHLERAEEEEEEEEED